MSTGVVKTLLKHQKSSLGVSARKSKQQLLASTLSLLIMAVLLMGCQDAKQTSADHRISLDKQSIMTVKMSKYQPSFAFDGTIIPVKSVVMTLTDPAYVNDVFVQAGNEVNAGDALLSYSPDVLDLDTLDQSNDLKLNASLDGTVAQLYAVPDTHYSTNTPLLELQDLSTLKFISRLSATLMDHIKIGDAVTFGVGDDTYTGQISQVVSVPDDSRLIDVHVMIPLDPSKDPKDLLGHSVVGHINYGQIQVGVMMPRSAIYDANMTPISLDEFAKPPHKPESPVDGQIWVIKQDHRLALSPVKLLEYHPKNQQFLVQGITEDSLVVTHALPKHAHGQEVHLK